MYIASKSTEMEKKTMKKILVLVLALILALSCFGAVAEEIDWRAYEGTELVVYGSCDEEHVAAVMEAFEAKTGIDVHWTRLSSNETYTRIKEERENPQADCWFGGTWDPYIAAANEGLLYAFEDANHAPYKSESFGVGEPYWFGIYSGYIGFICDTDALEEAGVPVPQSWEDLTKPEYEGMIVMANPGATGTGVLTTAVLFQLFGEEKALDLVSKIDPNVVTYVKTGSGTSAMVSTGEAAIGVGFLHTGLMYIEEGYDNIKLIAPSDGTGYEVGGAAIIEGAKNLDAAKLFINYAMTPECQEIGQTVGALQFLTVEGAQDPESAQALTGTKLMNYDSEWTGANKDDMIAKWTAAVNNEKFAQ